MKNIIIFGEYPTPQNIKDGMVQRIKAIDDEFIQYKRTYINLSFKSNFKKKYNKIDDKVEVYKLNLFLHIFIITRLLRNTTTIYFHSIYNYLFFVLFNKESIKTRFLDLHGSVPEELEFQGANRIKVICYNWIEKKAVSYCNNLVCVSNNMKEHILCKYPFTKKHNFIIKPIMPSNLNPEFHKANNQHEINELRSKLGINEEDVVLLYAGNLQKRQNFDLMLHIMSKIEKKNYYYIILTGQKNEAIQQIKNTCSNIKRIYVDSVSPNELHKYYSIAHYGFLLRDEHILNQVAAPTKLIEYLYYGLKPILKCTNIGDQTKYNYEYIKYDSKELLNLKPIKSHYNKNISKSIIEKAKNTSLNIF